MRRNFAFIATFMLLLAGTLLTALPVNAGPPVPTVTIAELREDVKKTEILLATFDNSCVILVNGLLNEIDIKILEIRKLITIGSGNTSPQNLLDLLLDALNDLNILGTYLVGFCPEILGTADSLDDGTIWGGVNFVIEEVDALAGVGWLDPRKARKILAILKNVGNPQGIENILIDANDEVDPDKDGTLGKLLEDIRLCVETPTDNNGDPSEECSTLPGAPGASASLLTVPAANKLVPELTPKGPFPFIVLRFIKVALGFAHMKVQFVLRIIGRLVKWKKFFWLALKEVENLLRNAGFGGFKNSEPVTLAQSHVQVYDMSGHLVYTGTEQELGRMGLANGMYVTVATVRGPNGEVRRAVHKVAVVH